MDILYRNYYEYISYLYEQSGNIIKRDQSVCYFDCTNYYFETETEDVFESEQTFAISLEKEITQMFKGKWKHYKI